MTAGGVRGRGRGVHIGAAIIAALLASARAPANAAGFDAHANSRQYAAEYRDPEWAGIYLRARWYHPELQSFISRDPAHTVTHYSYGGGNPVRNVDPNGMSYRSFARGVGSALRTLNAGAGGHFARFFLSPALGAMQILANPKGFWRMVQHDSSGVDVFLAVGVVSEVGFSGALWAERQPGLLLHVTHDLALGLGQSTAAAANRGLGRFNWGAFGQGAEYSIGPIVEGRLLGGLGYQPYRVRPEQAEKYAETLPKGQVAYYRARVGGWTTPIGRVGVREFSIKLAGSHFDTWEVREIVDGQLGDPGNDVFASLGDELKAKVGNPKAKSWLHFERTAEDPVLMAMVHDMSQTGPQNSALGSGGLTNLASGGPRQNVPNLGLQGGSSGTTQCSNGSLVILHDFDESIGVGGHMPAD